MNGTVKQIEYANDIEAIEAALIAVGATPEEADGLTTILHADKWCEKFGPVIVALRSATDGFPETMQRLLMRFSLPPRSGGK